ncbi:lysophospholipid acyltransferase family protein [Bacillus cereus group sp. TH152-1LC]|uniref:lysophospholipid acyltransferase family protein n=1 Tax=Bacillus cereus group sp. TH152-1LC TaxID=3018060 RepID=UPI0022E25E21|nr:lysophospholipid acyltransferase family protein [Bacillus cereus group sp. TH152-1LC]MDA1675734.1 lysophospholipid acyltransferase family protein [Bacillus cereus group sp. TH152-1LC]
MRTTRLYSYLFGYIALNLRKIRQAEKLHAEGKQKESFRLIETVAEKGIKKIIKIVGARTTIKGLENISHEETYLFVGNHQSNMDIPLVYACIPRKPTFIAKKEMEKIPLLGRVMKAKGCIFLDRNNPRNAIKSINEGVELLKSGENLVLFPEGTRSKGPKMNEFKAGGLKLALKSGVKIVPVTIKNSYMLMEMNNGKVKPADVEIIFSEPIDVSNCKDAVTLSADIQKIIEQNLRDSE